MTASTTPAGDKPLPTGWRGPVLPLNTPSGDMRQFMLDDGTEPAIRPLPVALSAQDEMWGAHEGSRVVGLVTRAWVQDGHLWAEGPLDLEDTFGAEYARKLRDGFAGWVSADLSDISLEEIPLRSDRSEWAPDELAAAYAAFEGGTGAEPDVGGQMLRVHEWKLMGVTGVSSPAFETSRIEPVYGDEFTAVRASAALTAAAEQHSGAMIALVPSAEDCARLAIDGYEPADVLHITLVFLGDAANWSAQQRDALEQAVRGLDFTSPLSGSVMGHAQFNPAGDEACAVYLVEARGLSATQSCTYGAVADTGDLPPIPEPYDTFLPHITAGYGLDVSKLTEVGPIRFDRIRLSFADNDVRDIPLEPVTASLVASSVVYDTADFTMPEPDELTALTVTDDGRVYGHLAQADSCHIGFADVCVSPPTSRTGYAYFHQGEISTTEGPLSVGKLTLGTGHAGMRQAARAAAEHYDNTGTAVAVVRCTDGLWGPWLSGRILPGVDDDRIDELRRSGVSGDWRSIQRGSSNLELVAVLAVNVPGFPVPRTRALAAAGMRSLIAAGIPPTRKHHDPPAATKKDIDIAHVRASALRKSRSQSAAQRVRAARLAAAARRIQRLDRRPFDESRHHRSWDGKFGRKTGRPHSAPDGSGTDSGAPKLPDGDTSQAETPKVDSPEHASPAMPAVGRTEPIGEGTGERWPTIPDVETPLYTNIADDGHSYSTVFTDANGDPERLPNLDHMPGHVLYGWHDRDSEHSLADRNGHLSGSEVERNTWFPQDLTEQQIVDMVRDTIENPSYYRERGTYRSVARMFDGNMIIAEWSVIDGEALNVAAFPSHGPDIRRWRNGEAVLWDAEDPRRLHRYREVDRGTS